MIRVSLAMVKQAPVTGQVRKLITTRSRGMSLLPRATPPEIVKSRARTAGALDALLVVAPVGAEKELFRQLPENERWQELNARAKPRAGTIRTTALTNRQQTLAVLGYIGTEASTFERLSLAGRMLKEVAAREPETIGLQALGEAAAAQAALDGLLAAALAHAFPLPSSRAPSPDEKRIKQITLHGEDGDA